MWSATKITADAADKMQANAGIILSTFDVKHPTEPASEDIVCDTTGDIKINCKPETTDFFEDVNNAPNNTMEGKRITGWNCDFSTTSLSVDEEGLKLGIGAAEVDEDGGISPRSQYKLSDFKTLYWVGDMIDENKLLVVKIDNAVSTEGITLTTTKNGKGKIGLTFTAHVSTADITKVPMTFYLLTKIGEYDSTRKYALNDLCTKDGTLYKCNTAITIPEEWNSAHWTEVV